MILHFERFNCSSFFIKVDKNEDAKQPPPSKGSISDVKKTDSLFERSVKNKVKTVDEKQLSPSSENEGIEEKKGPSKASKSDRRKRESLSEWSAKMKVINYLLHLSLLN